jgi:ATP-dependent DNA ligase
MVAKRTDGLYVGGRTRAWLKIKTVLVWKKMRKRSEAWKPAKEPGNALKVVKRDSVKGLALECCVAELTLFAVSLILLK